jgi:hypothetical protein
MLVYIFDFKKKRGAMVLRLKLSVGLCRGIYWSTEEG